MKSTSRIRPCIPTLRWTAPSFLETWWEMSSSKYRLTPRATSSKQKLCSQSATGSTKRSRPPFAGGTTSRPRSTAHPSPPDTTYTSISRPEKGPDHRAIGSFGHSSLLHGPITRSLLIRHLFASMLHFPPIQPGASDDAQSNQSPQEIRPCDGRDHRARRTVPHAVWRAHVSRFSRVDPLSAVEWKSGCDHLRSLHRSCRRSTDAEGHPQTNGCANAQRRALAAEDGVSARSCGEDRSRPAGVRAHAEIVGRRSDRTSHTGQGRRRLDGAYVPYVHVAPSGYFADRRLRRAGSH